MRARVGAGHLRRSGESMLWWQHLFAIWLLAHMVWACLLLQREWQRQRDSDPDPARRQPLRLYLGRESGVQAHRRYGALVLQAKPVSLLGRPVSASFPA